eukprot:3165531-Amphidinium_carterae.1
MVEKEHVITTLYPSHTTVVSEVSEPLEEDNRCQPQQCTPSRTQETDSHVNQTSLNSIVRMRSSDKCLSNHASQSGFRV